MILNMDSHNWTFSYILTMCALYLYFAPYYFTYGIHIIVKLTIYHLGAWNQVLIHYLAMKTGRVKER